MYQQLFLSSSYVSPHLDFSMTSWIMALIMPILLTWKLSHKVVKLLVQSLKVCKWQSSNLNSL